MGLTGGVDYPNNWEEFVSWFGDDAECRDYLDWLRWPDGFVCPTCGAAGRGWKRGDDRWLCGACNSIASQTAGTIFDKTRLPLTLWFAAGWHLTQQTTGISALGLKKELRLGSTQTAWHMLHRYRVAMVRADRTKLTGDVEVDETFVGGVNPGKSGRGSGKSIVAVAVELKNPRGYGRCRLQVIPDASGPTLHGFISDHVEVGSVVITDGWGSYTGIDAAGEYTHKAINLSQSPNQAHEELPAVHRVAALLKRWLLGTHQGSVSPQHLQAYLEEFTFRFNRRTSRQRGQLFYRLMEGAVATPPLRYDTLAKIRKPKKTKPTPPVQPQLTRPEHQPTYRPWRT